MVPGLLLIVCWTLDGEVQVMAGTSGGLASLSETSNCINNCYVTCIVFAVKPLLSAPTDVPPGL